MTAFNDPHRLSDLYRSRFGDNDTNVASRARHTTWQVLCDTWFPKYVRPTDTVLEMGCGRGEFINKVIAQRKIAVDLNPDTPDFLDDDVEFHASGVTSMEQVDSASVDVVFSSNLMEHLGSADTLLATLGECRRVLRPKGLLISLVPNAKHVGMSFYDFLDHTLPLTDTSFNEALLLSEFQIVEMIPRFLPYSAQNLRRAPSEWEVRTYLSIRPLWHVFGKQFFSVARLP